MPRRPTPLRSHTSARSALARLARDARGGILDVSIAARSLRVPRRRASLLLGQLARKGWLARVRRGHYILLPLESEPGRAAQAEDPWLLAARLFSPGYVGGWSAAEHWELTEQIFRSTFVVTAARVRRSNVRLAGLDFRLVRVPRSRVENVPTLWRGRERVAVSSPARTIADALDHPAWLGGLRNVASAISRLHASRHWDEGKLSEALTRVGRGAAYKRLGYLLEALALAEPDLIALCLRKRSKGSIALDPAVRAKGRLVKRWGLRANVHVGGHEEDG